MAGRLPSRFGSVIGFGMADRHVSSDDTHVMVARIAPAILQLLSDGMPRSRKEMVEALAPQHAKDEVTRTIMRLSVIGQLVQIKNKYGLMSLPEPDRS